VYVGGKRKRSEIMKEGGGKRREGRIQKGGWRGS